MGNQQLQPGRNRWFGLGELLVVAVVDNRPLRIFGGGYTSHTMENAIKQEQKTLDRGFVRVERIKGEDVPIDFKPRMRAFVYSAVEMIERDHEGGPNDINLSEEEKEELIGILADEAIVAGRMHIHALALDGEERDNRLLEDKIRQEEVRKMAERWNASESVLIPSAAKVPDRFREDAKRVRVIAYRKAREIALGHDYLGGQKIEWTNGEFHMNPNAWKEISSRAVPEGITSVILGGDDAMAVSYLGSDEGNWRIILKEAEKPDSEKRSPDIVIRAVMLERFKRLDEERIAKIKILLRELARHEKDGAHDTGDLGIDYFAGAAEEGIAKILE